jgi:hypothetical protein
VAATRQRARDVEPGYERHPDIEERDVGTNLLGQCQCLLAVFRFRDRAEFRPRLDKAPSTARSSGSSSAMSAVGIASGASCRRQRFERYRQRRAHAPRRHWARGEAAVCAVKRREPPRGCWSSHALPSMRLPGASPRPVSTTETMMASPTCAAVSSPCRHRAMARHRA